MQTELLVPRKILPTPCGDDACLLSVWMAFNRVHIGDAPCSTHSFCIFLDLLFLGLSMLTTTGRLGAFFHSSFPFSLSLSLSYLSSSHSAATLAAVIVLRAQLLLLFPLRLDVLLHPRQVVVDRVLPLGRRRRRVHASAQRLLDGRAAGGAVAGGRPACCFPGMTH